MCWRVTTQWTCCTCSEIGHHVFQLACWACGAPRCLRLVQRMVVR